MDTVQDTRRKNWGWFYYDLVDQWGPIIGADGLAVMMVLIRHADNENGQCFPSTATIAQKTGLSRRHVISTLHALTAHGLISTTGRTTLSADGKPVHQSNLYTILPLPGVLHSMHIPMQDMQGGTARDAQGDMHTMQEGYAQPAHKQDPRNKTQENKTHLTDAGDGDAAWNAITPAANHKLTPLQPVPKPTREQTTLDAFQPVADAYPARLGVLPDYDGGLAAFAAIPAPDWPRVLLGVQAFAVHEDATKENGRYVPSLPRFLADGWWKRYQPAAPKAPTGPPPRAAWLVELDERRAARKAREAAGQGLTA